MDEPIGLAEQAGTSTVPKAPTKEEAERAYKAKLLEDAMAAEEKRKLDASGVVESSFDPTDLINLGKGLVGLLAKKAAPVIAKGIAKKAIVVPTIPYLFKNEAAREAGEVALKYHPPIAPSTRSALTWGAKNEPVHPADFYDTMADIAARNNRTTEDVMSTYLERAGDPLARNQEYIKRKAAQGLAWSEADAAKRATQEAKMIAQAENRAAPSLADRVSEWQRADARIREINSFNNPARGNTFYNELAYLSRQQEGKANYIRKVIEEIHGAGSTSHMSDEQIIDYAQNIIRR